MSLLFLLLAAVPPAKTATLTLTATVGLHVGDGGCARCHDPEGWIPARFDHTQVGWPLEGQHAEVRCGHCHEQDLSLVLPRACDGCHRDPHRGELGLRCEGCHDPRTWRSRFGPEAHRRTAFPLSGATPSSPARSATRTASRTASSGRAPAASTAMPTICSGRR